MSAHQWPHIPCGGPSWLYRVGKRPPVKADLAIYGPSMVCPDSARVWLSCKMDFTCKLGFFKSSDIS